MEDLPEKVRHYQSNQLVPEGVDASALVSLEEMERRYILRVLEAVGGSKTEAARTLGIDRKTLGRKLQAWKVEGKAEDGD